MLRSLSNNTFKQYDSCLKQWWIFCKLEKADPFLMSVPRILSFLSQKFNEGSAYGTLNSIRSALSLLMDCDLGTQRDIKRFFNGIYKIRPSKPRYNETWNPALVLSYVSKLYPNISLTLEKLTKKLIILLALVTAHRLQTMSLIRLSNIIMTNENIKIKIPDTVKTSGKNRLQPLLVIPYYKDNSSICPATALKDYIDVTRSLRKSDKLFVTIRKPHTSASPHTLARWIKAILTEAGIDTSMFSAHSTRHASTSHAYRSGVNIDYIRKTAGWTESSRCFADYYNRPLINENVFPTSILNCL
jgi:hypothetical protein